MIRQSTLPDGWRWVRLGEICTVHPGQHILESDYNRNFRGIGYLTGPADFGRSSPTISKWTEKPKAWSEPGDVLVTVKGAGVGKINLSPKERVAIGRQLMAVRPTSDGPTRQFLFWILTTRLYELQSAALGSTVPGLGRENIESLKIPLPPPAEQKRIAAILNEQMATVERARAAAEARLEAAKALGAAYLRCAFRGLETERWPMRLIGTVAETCSGTTPSRGRIDYYAGSIPWVKTGELVDGVIQDTEEHVTERALIETSLRVLPAGTLLIAMYGQGQTRGRTGILAVPATTNQACFAILPNPDIFDSLYLQSWFRYGYSRIRSETEGRGGNQPNLNGELIRNLKVPIPPLADQQSMVARLSEQMMTAAKACRAIEEELDAINKLPAALLRRAFAGEM